MMGGFFVGIFLILFDRLAYLLLGFGLGYIMVLGWTGSYRATKLDRMKDDLAAKKEWIRMVSEAKKQKGKYNATSRV